MALVTIIKDTDIKRFKRRMQVFYNKNEVLSCEIEIGRLNANTNENLNYGGHLLQDFILAKLEYNSNKDTGPDFCSKPIEEENGGAIQLEDGSCLEQENAEF